LNYVVREGRRIAVETIELGIPPARRRHQAKAFTMMPLKLAAAMFKATNMPRAMVITVLLYEGWKAKGKPFALSNGQLNQFGISRFAKYRLLAELEAAKLIRVKRHGRRAPIITLL
jgi:hypothetical protein